MRVVRRAGKTEMERFRLANSTSAATRRSRSGAFFPIMGLLMGLGAIIVLWLRGRDVIAGRMTVGELVAFNAYLLMLAWPMIAFGWVTNLFQRGTASWKRMLDVLDAEPSIADTTSLSSHGYVRRFAATSSSAT